MILGKYDKQPAEVLDYDIDFTQWLPTTDSIVSAAASLEGTSDGLLVLGATNVFGNGKKVKQWVSGGTSGQTYQVQIRITTGDGRVKEAEFKVKVKEV